MLHYTFNGETHPLDWQQPEPVPPMSFQEWQIANDYRNFGMHKEQPYLTIECIAGDTPRACIKRMVSPLISRTFLSWSAVRLFVVLDERLQLWHVTMTSATLVADFESITYSVTVDAEGAQS